jgi:hypothetical protein
MFYVLKHATNNNARSRLVLIGKDTLIVRHYQAFSRIFGPSAGWVDNQCITPRLKGK